MNDTRKPARELTKHDSIRHKNAWARISRIFHIKGGLVLVNGRYRVTAPKIRVVFDNGDSRSIDPEQDVRYLVTGYTPTSAHDPRHDPRNRCHMTAAGIGAKEK